MCARGEHSVNITGQDVDFDIELSSGDQISQRRLLRGMRDDIDREVSRSVLRVTDIVDGERHAVERDRAFGGDHRTESAWDAHANAHRNAFGADTHDRRDGVDMARDDMPAKLVPKAERAFEVEPRPFT